MLEPYAQEIIVAITNILPESKWNCFVAHAILLEGSFQFDIYYCLDSQAQYIKDTALMEDGRIRRQDLINCYFALRKIVTAAQKDWSGEPYTGFTLSANDEGRFTVDYEYDEQGLGCTEQWKQRYLR